MPGNDPVDIEGRVLTASRALPPVVEGHAFPVSVCIVNYNGEHYIEETLSSILQQKGKFKEILLIDNASADRSCDIVRTRYPNVKIVRLPDNVGLAAGRNIGFTEAENDWILFVDNDVSLTEGCIEALLEALQKNPRAVAAMPRVLYKNAADTIQYDGAGVHFLGLMTLHSENLPVGLAARELKKIGSIVGACFLVNRERWGNGKPFDDSFFIYFDDHDFGVKSRILGHELVSSPIGRVLHREGTAGFSLRRHGSYSRSRVFYLIRNRWQMILKYYSARTVLALTPALLTYELFQLAGVVKKGWFRQWVESAFWIVSNFFPLMKKRRSIQKSRMIPDGQILEGGPIPFTTYLTKTRLDRAGKEMLDALATAYWNRIRRYIH